VRRLRVSMGKRGPHHGDPCLIRAEFGRSRSSHPPGLRVAGQEPEVQPCGSCHILATVGRSRSSHSSGIWQGKNLGFNHAAQSCARIVSPLLAGILYERSKKMGTLPPGALPYIAGALFPLLGIMVPTVLYLRSIEAKKAAGGKVGVGQG
jgi:hypothetical protein